MHSLHSIALRSNIHKLVEKYNVCAAEYDY